MFVAVGDGSAPPDAVDPSVTPPDASPADLPAWIERLTEARVIADRVTCPDLTGQLQSAMRRPIDTVICTLLPTDQHLRLEASLAATYSVEIAAAVNLLGRLTGAPQRWIVHESDAPPPFLRPIRRSADASDLRLVGLDHDYPLDHPVPLLRTLLNRRLLPGRSPAERGVILIDAPAAMAIGRLALLGQLTTSVPVAIRDHERGVNHHLWVSIGTPLRQVLAAVGWADLSLVHIGYPLREISPAPDALIGTGELVFHIARPDPPAAPDACIRCGWCIDGCPVRIHPPALLDARQFDDPDLAERAGLRACIECGICSFVCPARLPLLQSIRELRHRHG